MTQPPPYQGGYPQQPDPYGAGNYGQPTPPPGGGYPQAGPPGGFPPPGGGSPSGFPPAGGGTPSGFPPAGGGPGMPPPKPSGKGKVLGAVGGIVVLVVAAVVIFGAKALLREGADQINSESKGKTDIAEVDDCTTKFTNKYTTDASDVKVVKCDSKDAFFQVVKREDNPSGSDGEKAGDELCTGTKAADFIYMEDGSGGLDWIICLDPINIETAEYGAMPAKSGQCLSDNDEYFEIVDCGDGKAYLEVLTAEDNPDPSLTDGDSAFAAICDQNSTMYFTSESANDDVGPYEWFLCTVEVTK